MKAEFLLTREKNRELSIHTVKNQTYRMHFHSHIEICIVLDGEVEVWINDQRKILKQGDLSVAWSYDTHGYHTLSDSTCISIIIPPHMFSEFLPRLSNRHASSSFISDPVLFQKIYGWATEIQQSEDPLIRKGLIYVILGTLIQYSQFEKSQEPADHPLSSRILLYLNEHFREDLTLSSVAHALGYHPNYLSYVFKNTLKLGFNEYLTILRLRESLLLMQDGSKSVTECAFGSGFQSLRTFYRAFQGEFGCSPRDFFSESNLVGNK